MSQSIIHRSQPGFVVQGGGYVTNFSAIPQNPAVVNEPVYSNVRGTIAMAKTAAGPSTATSQWFFNLANSAANLDNQNGGFTVFGQVNSNGMATVDAIAAIPTYNQGGAFTNIPLQNYTAPNAVVLSNLIFITSVTVMDPTVDSAAGLSRPLTTRTTIGGGGNGGGGGSFDLLFLIGLLLFGRSRFMRS
ncbi:MAG: peptidylprolyl isomerase [Proteobacteria bacterium]|nr:peptidylprolyl isomerase [Pseudomonadota bacterium]